MNQQIFVPVTDDMVYNHPEQIEGPLVPYFAGMECQNWLSIEINPDETKPLTKTLTKSNAGKVGLRAKTKRSSRLHLAYSA